MHLVSDHLGGESYLESWLLDKGLITPLGKGGKRVGIKDF
jgi:hypothetical protein